MGEPIDTARTRRQLLLAGGSATAVALAGCSGSDDSDGGTTDTTPTGNQDSTEDGTEDEPDGGTTTSGGEQPDAETQTPNGDSIDAETAESVAEESITAFVEQDAAALTDSFNSLATSGLTQQHPSFYLGEPFDDVETTLNRIWDAIAGQYGTLDSRGELSLEQEGSSWVATSTLTYETGQQRVHLEIDADAEVTGFSLPSEYSPPEYADESSFVEQDLAFERDGIEYPGTLTVPEGASNPPCVVIAPGGSASTRDFELGASRLFRDLAWGLADQGIASFRYDRETHMRQYSIGERDVDAFVVDPAVTALETVAATDSVDSTRLFVLGYGPEHTLTPLIASRYGELAGMILLMTPPRFSPDPFIRTRERLADAEWASESEIELFERQLAQLEDARTRDVADDELVAGFIAGSIWNQFDEYDVESALQGTDTPAFVIQQGANDLQLAEDFFQTWTDIVPDDQGDVRLYDETHLVLHPAETQHVPPEALYFHDNAAANVIGDIASWITGD